ncbi:unnamed protein product [Albugo candida]|uniref:Uncharacterized protein n=1 Tax=Albugo candida TaxID=65357 RepID=A0A024FUZ8_9STRA|nr:unnamed protein product [Albugo candida]|eukprot:CCI10752.1 unnamed protein product [Albugo candida]
MSTKFYTIDADESGKMDHERVSGQKKKDRGTHEDKLEPKNTQEKLLELLTGLTLGTGPSGGLADSTLGFRPCVHRFESWRWQKGCDGAPRRRQRFLHVNISLLNEDMDVSRPLATTPENNCTGVGPGSSERYILVIRIE